MLRKVTVETGILEGIPASDPRVTAFKGVPFAAPPVGKNRWRAPQPAEAWVGVRDCSRFAPISVQHVPGLDPENIYTREWNVDPEIPMSEDCLYLNVWTPAKSADEKLPVFVWYFGGGLREGNTQEMEFDGERLARRGIIVVTINYRLNAFGFLTHPEITAENPDFPANFGYLDQRFGTLWVKRNIAAFGGDPENITIGGQSAGGGSTMAQVACPLNKGLFQKAIVDSGLELMPYPPGMFGPLYTLAEGEEIGRKFFEVLGVKTLAEARELDAFYIRDKMEENRFSFPTVKDDIFITGPSNELFMKGEANMVPILCGHTSTEFPSAPRVKDFAELREYAEKTFGDKAEEFLSLITSKYGSFRETMYKARMQHLEFSCRMLARAKALTGDDLPMYYWVFDAEIPGWDDPGTFHSCDLWFFFENFWKCWRPYTGKHFDLSRKMANYWANFIKNGDPNGKDADGTDMPLWKPYTVEEPCRMIFGDAPYTEEAGPSELLKFLMENSMY